MALAEVDIARPVVDWLHRHEWEVYQEVSVAVYGAVADIVAVRGKLIWVVEVKRSRTLSLLDQARGWVGHANLVSVATPVVRQSYQQIVRGTTWDWCLEQLGLGYFVVGSAVHASIRKWPKLQRRRTETLESRLREEHKTYCAAGSTSGDRWTPFRDTVAQLRKVAERQPGILLVEAVDSISHHYANDGTARGALRKWAMEGRLPGVDIRVADGRVRVWPARAHEGAAP